MTRYLFLGGSAHGRMIEVEGDRDVWNVDGESYPVSSFRVESGDDVRELGAGYVCSVQTYERYHVSPSDRRSDGRIVYVPEAWALDPKGIAFALDALVDLAEAYANQRDACKEGPP